MRETELEKKCHELEQELKIRVEDNAEKKVNEQNADLSQKVHILNEANEKNYNALCDEIKKNNKLQEQLKEANNIIKQYCFYEYGRPYIEKWGVK